MLMEYLNEEKKRFNEQMKSELNAQRDQMKNMMDANMKQTQEERRAFNRKNEALKDRFRAMQESNENTWNW